MDISGLFEEAKKIAEEVCQKTFLKPGQTVIVGCSTSEIGGALIGSSPSTDIARAVFGGLHEVFSAKNIFIAAQCCEHLNRAVVAERSGFVYCEPVNAVPRPHAGGSFAAFAYESFADPVVLEHIKADAGIDIGGTLIGMHLKEIAVPVRLEHNRIGEAPIICARTRPKYIGGSRSQYDENLM